MLVDLVSLAMGVAFGLIDLVFLVVMEVAFGLIDLYLWLLWRLHLGWLICIFGWYGG